MIRWLARVLLGSIALAVLACGGHFVRSYRTAIADNQRAISELRLGMPADQVRSVMGNESVRYKKIHFQDPWRSESFSLLDGTSVLVLYYVTQPTRRYAGASDAELTPVVLEGGKLVGWGWAFLRQNNERYRVAEPKEQR
jgi:hypothetical protein